MRSRPPVVHGNFQQGANATCRARLAQAGTSPYAEGTPYVAADVSSITVSVYSQGDVIEGWNQIGVDVAEVVLASLLGWERDDVGYNFEHTIGPEAFPVGSVLAEVAYTFVMADGTQWTLKFVGPVEAVP